MACGLEALNTAANDCALNWLSASATTTVVK